MDNPITYEIYEHEYVVKYQSPSRKFGDLREELNNDAKLIGEKYGKVYVAFSSGVDSQVILRCFLDMKVDFEPFFIHVKGRNDFEKTVVELSEKFYGIKIKILEVQLEEHREEWEARSISENFPTLVHYPFELASKMLPENYPMIMSGANEPAIIGNRIIGLHIYHNYHESLRLRFNLINKHRTILDFPYSAESLASYYCDDLIKIWGDVCNYYITNDLVVSGTQQPMVPGSRFNYYLKGLLKGKYFKKDILWPSKKSGYENYPNWMIPHWAYPKEAHISVNYNDVVQHLESCSGSIKEFKDWIF
jgi:hypothetical protein